MAKHRAKRKKRTSNRPVRLPPLPRWGMGPEAPATCENVVIEDALIWDDEKEKYVNPNNVKRARRIDMCEVYFNRGQITRNQLKAALELRGLYEATMKSQPAIKQISVDNNSIPDLHVSLMVARVCKFYGVMRHVPVSSKPVINAVVLDNQSIGYLKQYRASRFDRGLAELKEGLEAVADSLELPKAAQ